VRQRGPQPAGNIDIEKICREHSLPLTTQRRTVLEALALRQDHPTVDEIWADVRQRTPEISRTTVYRILEVFALLRVVCKVGHPGATARYEIRIGRHHHLLCLDCGVIVDLEDPALDTITLPGKDSGFRIEDYSIQFRGLCSRCAAGSASRTTGGSTAEITNDNSRARTVRSVRNRMRKQL